MWQCQSWSHWQRSGGGAPLSAAIRRLPRRRRTLRQNRAQHLQPNSLQKTHSRHSRTRPQPQTTRQQKPPTLPPQEQEGKPMTTTFKPADCSHCLRCGNWLPRTPTTIELCLCAHCAEIHATMSEAEAEHELHQLITRWQNDTQPPETETAGCAHHFTATTCLLYTSPSPRD